ncbi:nucleoside 2-deoxyribosyltransferase, partial [Candidatus Bathyarchaeota archaeon]|nr:nucleoside 2-deoxyribosyltransferase [Candidatus Bathyarchaeota archaeon]
MRVYFAGSIRGEEPDRDWFQELIRHISKTDRVLTEHSFDFSYEDEIKKDDHEIWETDINWLQGADAVIGEITAPSLGVGYEIGKAEEWGKPILLLYRETPDKKTSAMLNGSKFNELITYNEKDEALKAIDDFL